MTLGEIQNNLYINSWLLVTHYVSILLMPQHHSVKTSAAIKYAKGLLLQSPE